MDDESEDKTKNCIGFDSTRGDDAAALKLLLGDSGDGDDDDDDMDDESEDELDEEDDEEQT